MTTTVEQQKNLDLFAKYMLLLKEKRDISKRLHDLDGEFDYNEENEVTLLFEMKDDDDDDDNNDITFKSKRIPTVLKIGKKFH